MLGNASAFRINSDKGLSYFNHSSNQSQFNVSADGVLDTKQIGTAKNPINSIHTKTADIEELSVKGETVQAAVGRYIVPIAPGLDFSDIIDPANTQTPLQDAFDVVGQAGGGTVLLPHRGSIDSPGSVVAHSNITLEANNCDINFTGNGDGFVVAVDESNYSTETFVEGFNIRGRLDIFGKGQTAGQGFAMRFGNENGSKALRNSEWNQVRIHDWDGVAWKEYTHSLSFQNVFHHIHFDRVDAGNVKAIMDVDNGGAPTWIGYISAYPESKGSGSDSCVLYVTDFNATIGIMNIGGTAKTVINGNAGTVGISVQQINWEPENLNTYPYFLVGSSGSGPMRVNSISIWHSVSAPFEQYNGENNYWGAVKLMGESSVDTGYLINENDTAGNTITEFGSDKVYNSASDTLTYPISCLGDMSSVS